MRQKNLHTIEVALSAKKWKQLQIEGQSSAIFRFFWSIEMKIM